MLLQAAMDINPGGSITSFILIILVWLLVLIIPITLIYLLIKKVIKPVTGYFKAKQEYYQAQTEAIKKEKAE